MQDGTYKSGRITDLEIAQYLSHFLLQLVNHSGSGSRKNSPSDLITFRKPRGPVENPRNEGNDLQARIVPRIPLLRNMRFLRDVDDDSERRESCIEFTAIASRMRRHASYGNKARIERIDRRWPRNRNTTPVSLSLPLSLSSFQSDAATRGSVF